MLTQIGYLPVFAGIAITLLTVFLFLRSLALAPLENPARSGKRVMAFLFLWLLLQGAWGFSGFYRQFEELPPTIFICGIGPALLAIALLFLVKKWRAGVMKLDLEALTWLHVVRLPVELGLLMLAHHKVVSNEMSLEGRNFDIASGITAPLVAWLVFRKNKGGKKLLIAWNLAGLALLLNIVITAILSAPFPFQKFGLDQPNIAVFYFPYVWLPTVIVPIVLFSHLVSLAKLFSKKD